MGFMDKVKATAEQAVGKANELAGQASTKMGELADEHGDKVKGAVDKAAGTVDEKTKGKYSDKIAKGSAKAKDAVDKVAEDGKK